MTNKRHFELCWFCHTKIKNDNLDNALIWDVRLCCKKCFRKQLEEYNDSLNKKIAQQQGFKQEKTISNKHISSNNSPIIAGSGGEPKE